MNNSGQAAIIRALRKVPVTKEEMADLLRLYDSPSGFPYTTDAMDRPKGETIRRCSSFGARVRKVVGRKRGFGMSLVGYCDPATATWRMRPQFRAAMRELGWTNGTAGTLVDEVDELDDLGDVQVQARVVAEQEDAIRNSERISEDLREQLIQARMGQGQFRQSVEKFEKTCRVTGLGDLSLLRASHMKPWSACSNAERLDGANGLLIAPRFHLLFSKGCISFDREGHLLVSRKLSERVIRGWPVTQTAQPRPFLPAQLEYVAFHASRIFKPQA